MLVAAVAALNPIVLTVLFVLVFAGAVEWLIRRWRWRKDRLAP